jgi:hypothetical protein
MILFYGNPLNSTRGCIKIAVTTAVVTKNVRMTRRWKAELVAYGICKQPSLVCQSVQKVFSTSS